jgi:uncharacterized damage-inducible protein DinB
MTYHERMDSRDIFALTVRLRRRVLAALQPIPHDLSTRNVGTNHTSILRTLIHIMAVEESWVAIDLEGGPELTWEEFSARYLPHGETLESVISGWQAVTRHTVQYLLAHPDLSQSIEITGPNGSHTLTVDQVILHLVGEELIHMGEVLAMTRQLNIDLPAYHLLSAMLESAHPWEELVGEATP